MGNRNEEALLLSRVSDPAVLRMPDLRVSRSGILISLIDHYHYHNDSGILGMLVIRNSLMQ